MSNHRDPQRRMAEGETPQDQKSQDEGLVANGFRQVKRLLVLVVGGLVILAGIVMLVTPGPGLIAIAVGLGILSIEFTWARRLLHKFKEKYMVARNAMRERKTANASKKDREAGS